MIVKVLGSSAGGGFPQWNCACANCTGLRRRDRAMSPRSQSQVAISADGRRWHLLNASPDLRAQIGMAPELQPGDPPPLRQTPIGAIVLTGADLDHVLGLLLLRESQPLQIFAAEPVIRILLEDNSFFGMLRQFDGQTSWTVISPAAEFALGAGLRCTPVGLSSRFPAYVLPERATALASRFPDQAVLGLVIRDEAGHSLGYFPGIGELSAERLAAFAGLDLLLLDGTFWSEDELIRVGGGARTATQMGHVPMSGERGSLARTRTLRCARKAFIHINNTNPVLNESGPEHEILTASGWELTYDGWTCEL
jgi:pyrroloquinoline quinone biosynthesis protein B